MMSSKAAPHTDDASPEEAESLLAAAGSHAVPTSHSAVADPLDHTTSSFSHAHTSAAGAAGGAYPDTDLPLRHFTADSDIVPTSPSPRPPTARRQSSMSKPASNGGLRTPRTSNRVRFDLESTPTIELKTWDDGADRMARGGRPDSPLSPVSGMGWRHSRDDSGGSGWLARLGFGRRDSGSSGGPRSPTPNGYAAAQNQWMEEEDPLTGGGGDDDDFDDNSSSGRRESAQRERLLDGMEAGPVRAALDEDHANQGIEAIMRPGTRKGMGSAFMNMANSIIGAGIIGQPYMLRQAGLVTGLTLLVGLTLIVDWTIRLIVLNSKLSGADSFQTTMEYCFGKKGMIAISLAQWAFAFGGMLAFCVIIGDTIPHVLVAVFPSLPDREVLWLFSDRRFIIVFFVMSISYPLSLYRDIAKLAKASTLALVSMVVILITVITQGAMVDSELRGNFRGSLVIRGGVFQAIGVISFAFVCHHNSLLIYGSLQKPTLDRFARVTHFSTGVSCGACFVMALAGFLNFGDKTQGNVLNNFPTDNVMVNVARLCFGLNMLTTLPLECFVCREVMLTYFHPLIETTSGGRTPLGLHVLYTTLLVISSVLLSLLTCDLGAVFEIIGATSAASLAFVFPPLCWLYLTGRGRRARGQSLLGSAWRANWKRWGAGATAVFGIAVAIISTVMAVIDMISGDGEGKQCT